MIIASSVVGYSSHTMPNIIETRLFCPSHHMLQHGRQVVSRIPDFRGPIKEGRLLNLEVVMCSLLIFCNLLSKSNRLPTCLIETMY